ncbi:hypothetical protein GGF43_006083, partial [Coemansia sp. RSA 2618]
YSSTLGPDDRTSVVVLSDESQRLIDSIFDGRLSIDRGQRFSRSEGSASTAGIENSNSAVAQPEYMAPNGVSRQDSGGRSRPRMGSAWTAPS